MHAAQFGDINQGLIFNISEDLFAKNIYQLREEQVNDVFRNHFEIDDHALIAIYHKKYEDASNDSKNGHIRSISPILSQTNSDEDDEGDGLTTWNQTNIIIAITRKMHARCTRKLMQKTEEKYNDDT